MNNMLMRNTKLAVTALAMMVLLACGGLSEAEEYNNQGVDFADSGDFETAIASYSTAIELDRDYAMAYNNRGQAYYSLEQYDKALVDITRVIELDPNDKEAIEIREWLLQEHPELKE
jgi:tetratricopeptide (TPR) repeat protein